MSSTPNQNELSLLLKDLDPTRLG